MLCGLSKPTHGDAFIFGKSIMTDKSEIRSMMGVCPQVIITSIFFLKKKKKSKKKKA